MSGFLDMMGYFFCVMGVQTREGIDLGDYRKGQEKGPNQYLENEVPMPELQVFDVRGLLHRSGRWLMRGTAIRL
jgi:hypothetical protein